MANLDQVLGQLREERGRAQQQLEQLDSAISVLEGIGGSHSNGSRASSRTGRAVSAIARRRMASAQRARWSKVSQGGKLAGSTRVTRVLSADARRRIANAQKARWAKFRAEKKAAAA